MEDLTLALITLTSFVLLFVVAIFADRAGTELEESQSEPAFAAADTTPATSARADTRHVDVA